MSLERWILFTAIALPFFATGLMPAVYRLLGERAGYVGAAVAALSFGLVASQTGANGTVAVEWIPSLDVALRLRVDGLALLFALLASGIGVLIFGYSTRYMHGKPALGRFYAALLAFMGSVLGVAFAADLVALFLFWELTSVCSFVLIGYHTGDDESQASARMAMLLTVGGGLCLLVAVLLLGVAAGTVLDGGPLGVFDLSAILAESESVRAALESSDLLLPVLALVTVAAGAKSAQVPFHFWLPRAMVAPTPVSAFLHSATMVKVGVYALGRLRPLLGGPEWGLVLTTLGLTTMLVGAVLAVRSRDIKKLLAYSTASHLGLMVAAFGSQPHYGPEAGAFHLLNHALFKAALFLVAGIIVHEVGTRHIDRLGGLWRDLPVTAAITGVAALSMAGIPPLNGFYSKELLFAAAWDIATTSGGLAWLYPVVAVLASVFTVLYSLRFLWMFVGEQPSALGDPEQTPTEQTVTPKPDGSGQPDATTDREPHSDDDTTEDSDATDQDHHGDDDTAGHTDVTGGHHGGGVGRPSALLVVPPAVLAVLAALVSVRPALAIDLVVQDSAAAAGLAGEDVSVHATVPFEVSGPAVMSLVTVTAGIALFPVYGPVRDLLDAVHRGGRAAHPARVYRQGLNRLGRASVRLDATVHSGLIRTYVWWVFAATCTVTLVGYAATGASPALTATGAPVAMVLVLGVAVLAALAVTLTPSHVTGVLTLGLLGFMIAIFYILASGPDLALTQLVVETLLLVVFLVVIEKMAPFYVDTETVVVLRDAALSVLVGATAFVSVLVAAPTGAALTDTAEFYVDNAVDGGGGSNIVNVILTDFRALDTLGEAVVIVLAAVSVLVLLTMYNRGETQ